MNTSYKRTIPSRSNTAATRKYLPDPMGRIGQGSWIDASQRPDLFPEFPSARASQDRTRPAANLTADLSASVGANGTNRPDDVAQVENLLGKSGHLDTAKTDGPTGFFGDRLKQAIRTYQKDGGLKQDGALLPGGETIAALGRSLSAQQPKNKTQTTQAPNATPPSIAPTKPDGAPKSPPSGKAGETQVAMAPALLLPLLLGSGLAAAGATDYMSKRSGEIEKWLKSLQNGKRRDITPPMPPLPGIEPPKDHERLPNTTEFPADPVELPDLSHPIPEFKKPTIFIHPMPDEDLMNSGMIVDRNESESTRNLHKQIRDKYLKDNPEYEHKSGGHDKKTGEEKPEYYVPGPGIAFALPGRKYGDGRKRSGYTDLTFAAPDGKTFNHIQTVDVDKYGKVTQRELDNAERIRKALQGRERKDGTIERHNIILIPKPWQIKHRK